MTYVNPYAIYAEIASAAQIRNYLLRSGSHIAMLRRAGHERVRRSHDVVENRLRRSALHGPRRVDQLFLTPNVVRLIHRLTDAVRKRHKQIPAVERPLPRLSSALAHQPHYRSPASS